MQNRNRAWALGFVVWRAIGGCTPSVHELGDAPLVSAGGSGGSGKGGSGSVVAEGGSKTTSTAGAPGTLQNVAGAPPEPEACFSPTQNVGLALEDALGCPCSATDPNGLAECVQTEHDGRPARVNLYCEEGKWTNEPRFPPTKPVCGDGRQADCRVDGVSYVHGARRVPAPFSRCNTCVCNAGELVDCTGYRCADTECDEGSFRSKRCVECGPVDQCLEVETGCLSGPGCEAGFCEEGSCP